MVHCVCKLIYKHATNVTTQLALRYSISRNGRTNITFEQVGDRRSITKVESI